MKHHFVHLSSALSYLPKSMFISQLLIMSVSVVVDTVDINQILLYSNFYSFMTKKKKKKKNTVDVLKSDHIFVFLQNAYKCSCSPRTDVEKIVSELLYLVLIDSLRQQFYPRSRPRHENLRQTKKGIFLSHMREKIFQL